MLGIAVVYAVRLGVCADCAVAKICASVVFLPSICRLGPEATRINGGGILCPIASATDGFAVEFSFDKSTLCVSHKMLLCASIGNKKWFGNLLFGGRPGTFRVPRRRSSVFLFFFLSLFPSLPLSLSPSLCYMCVCVCEIVFPFFENGTWIVLHQNHSSIPSVCVHWVRRRNE